MDFNEARRSGWVGLPGRSLWAVGDGPRREAYDAKQKSLQYEEGQPLGDIVLAAEEPFGKGRIVVLGDMSCLNNERLSCSYEFVGRLLGYLANRSSTPQAIWRQLLAIASIILLLGLLVIKNDAMQDGVTSAIFALALVLCTWNSNNANPVLPDGRGQTPNKLAYIDTSHLEAFSSDLWNDFGIAGFTRVLMRNGFLPLRLRELTAERLERAGILVSIAPARQFRPRNLPCCTTSSKKAGH